MMWLAGCTCQLLLLCSPVLKSGGHYWSGTGCWLREWLMHLHLQLTRLYVTCLYLQMSWFRATTVLAKLEAVDFSLLFSSPILTWDAVPVMNSRRRTYGSDCSTCWTWPASLLTWAQQQLLLQAFTPPQPLTSGVIRGGGHVGVHASEERPYSLEKLSMYVRVVGIHLRIHSIWTECTYFVWCDHI